MGSDNEVYPFASLGMKTQDLKWKKAEALVRDEGWEVVEVLSE